MSEQAKATAVKFFEEQDRLRGGPAEELCAAGYIARIASLPPMDLAGHSQFAAAFYAGFPDLRHTIEDVIAEGDRVCNPASGKPIDVEALALIRISSAKVAEIHGQFDQMGPLQQIGALPGV